MDGARKPWQGAQVQPPRAISAPVTAAVVVLALVTAVHLVAQLTDQRPLADVTQWFLMPLLALALWLAAGPARAERLVRVTVVALGFSWLGDAAPDVVPDDVAFITMLGFFLVAHVVYLIAFWPLRERGVIGRRPVLVLPYVVVLAVLLAIVLPGAGELAVPVVGYGAVLTCVAVLATFDRVAAIGGVLFIVSDAFIALNSFADHPALPVHGFWVMLTYVGAQALLVAGVLRMRAPLFESA